MARIATSPQVTYRLGAVDDSYTVFVLFEKTLADVNRRLGSATLTSAADPVALARMWEERRSLDIHLALTAEHFWLAERAEEPVGFARSIHRGGVRQLTELFVLPEQQSAGVGHELFARVFPANGARRRVILASADVRAQARYLKAGLYPRFPVYYFGRSPELIDMDTDLSFEPVTASPETLAAIGALDDELLGFRRDEDHAWLLEDRQGFLYLRRDHPVGYGYLGARNGPFGLLDPGDHPTVLAHAESRAARLGLGHFGIEVPLVNQVAVDYLLARGYRLDTLMTILMSDVPFGDFQRYIFTSPPFFA
ncbi:GNAT family N-acetyltransferase [Chloroflexota bacterium]